MLYQGYSISLLEFPDEIALCFNISNCPCHCKGCSESYLSENKGDILNETSLCSFLNKYIDRGITLVGFMGGDSYTDEIKLFSKVIHEKGLKVGFYSGRDYLDLDLARYLDYYKYGRWILPEGKEEDWHKNSCGPMNFPWSNQKMFKKEDNKLIDITYKFRKDPISDLNRYVIKNI